MKKLKTILSAGIVLCIGVSSLTTAFAVDEINFTYDKIGDFNNDKIVDVEDVTSLQMQLAGYNVVDDSKIYMTDFNGDEVFDVDDITDTQKMLAGIDYVCYVETDASHLDMDILDTSYFPQYIENKIEFAYVLSSNELLPVVNNQYNFLIHSKEQFAHLFGATSPDFDDSFFEEYSLFIWRTYCAVPRYHRNITEMGIDGNQLVINKKIEYPDENYKGPEKKEWSSFYKIKKSEISNIESVFICNLEIWEP